MTLKGACCGVTPVSALLILFSTFLAMVLSGCSMGPRIVQGNRIDYNVSLQKSANEELVLNIVRARYWEPPLFLQVGAVSSSFGYSIDMGLGATFMRNLRNMVPAADTVTPSLGARFSESPTITYTPLQGETLVRQLQAELRLDHFLILTRSGFSIESLMWLTMGRIGDFRNFNVTVESDAETLANYRQFLDLAFMLRTLQERGDLEFTGLAKGTGGEDILAMQVRFLDEREASKVEGLLGVRPEKTLLSDGSSVAAIEFTSVRDLTERDPDAEGRTRVPVKLKSFFEILYDLSSFVEVSPAEQLRRVARPVPPAPAEIEFRPEIRPGLHAGPVRIRNTFTRPDDAYVAVSYRDRWFSIDDSDLRSKAYLMLLGSIFSLQSGDLQTVTPLLTIPVGR